MYFLLLKIIVLQNKKREEGSSFLPLNIFFANDEFPRKIFGQSYFFCPYLQNLVSV